MFNTYIDVFHTNSKLFKANYRNFGNFNSQYVQKASVLIHLK